MDDLHLQELSQTQLNDYLWHRLRLEEPMDPPLERRFRMEPPEGVFIRVARLPDGGPPFRSRVIQAIDDNLRRFIKATAGSAVDATENEQLASLAFLAASLEAHELHDTFYRAVLYAEVAEGVAECSYFHLLRSLALLQQGGSLTPFWQALLDDSRPSVRAIAYYGLSRASAEYTLQRLPQLLEDELLDLPPIVWHLATEVPGVIALGQASRERLTNDAQTDRLLKALKEAGADEEMLRDYQSFAGSASLGFIFSGTRPKNPQAARKKPSWSPHTKLQQAA